MPRDPKKIKKENIAVKWGSNAEITTHRNRIGALKTRAPFPWSRRQDSNLRPPAPKAGALPNCATPRNCSQN